MKHETYVREHDENGPRARESQLLANMDQLQRIMVGRSELESPDPLRLLNPEQNRAPFIIVLVDGDNMMFNQAYLRDGANGGMRAAAALHDAVAEWAAANVVDCDADVKVVVRVYASVKSLADAYIRSGVVTSPTQVEEFSRGFTRGNALFDFVDLGYGKGGADADDKLAGKSHVRSQNFWCPDVPQMCSIFTFTTIIAARSSWDALTTVAALVRLSSASLTTRQCRGSRFSRVLRSKRNVQPFPSQRRSSQASSRNPRLTTTPMTCSAICAATHGH